MKRGVSFLTFSIALACGAVVVPVEAGVIKDDCLVNADTSGRCPKVSLPPPPSSAGMNRTGECVVVWVDERNGDPDIYCQRYDAAGNPRGENFRVNADSGMDRQAAPSVTVTETGSFIVTWGEQLGDLHIFAQRYDENGNPVGSRISVDSGLTRGGEKSSVAGDGKGNFVVAWVNSGQELYPYIRLFDSSGTPKTGSIKVCDTLQISMGAGPSVAMDSAGNFVAVWRYKNIIYTRYFDPSGVPQGAAFRVSEDTTSRKDYPSAAMNDRGNLVVAWFAERNGYLGVYCQVFNVQGSPIGNNFEVGTLGVSKDNPSVGIDGNGNFTVVWRDERVSESNPDIYAQCFDRNGKSLGLNFKVNDDTGEHSQDYPKIGVSNSGGFFIAWMDSREGSCVYGQRYASNGKPTDQNIRINDDEASAHQINPRIAISSSGEFLIMWWDANDSRTYLQMFDAEGNPEGNNRFSDIIPAGTSVATDSAGNYVIVGEEDVPDSYYHDIVGQKFDREGLPLGTKLKVNTEYGYNSNSVVGMNRKGQFVVAWVNENHIFGQRYDGNGNPMGTVFPVSEDTILTSDPPDVAVFDDGGFAFVYQRPAANWLSEVLVRCYDTEGSPLGPSSRVGKPPMISSHYPAIASDGIERFVVVFYGASTIVGSGIFYQLYDLQGNTIGPNQWVPGAKINPDPATVVAAVAMDTSGRFVIFWTQQMNSFGNPDVWAQGFGADSIPYTDAVQINNQDSFPYNYQFVTARGVAVAKDRVVFTWRDNRRHKGWDIYAKVTDWDIAGIDESVERRVYSRTLTVFPNPARHIASISFTLSEFGPVSLKIYDACGRLVQTLIRERLKEGEHTLKLSTENLPQGVYFIELKQGEKRTTEKLLVLK